jgi:hypothetical protein
MLTVTAHAGLLALEDDGMCRVLTPSAAAALAIRLVHETAAHLPVRPDGEVDAQLLARFIFDHAPADFDGVAVVPGAPAHSGTRARPAATEPASPPAPNPGSMQAGARSGQRRGAGTFSPEKAGSVLRPRQAMSRRGRIRSCAMLGR